MQKLQTVFSSFFDDSRKMFHTRLLQCRGNQPSSLFIRITVL